MLAHPAGVGVTGPQAAWAVTRPWSPWDEEHPWLPAVLDLLCQPGGPFPGEHAAHWPRIQWQLRTGQWVALGEPGHLVAWLGFWLVSDADWGRLPGLSEDDLIRGAPMPGITQGRHLYIVDAVAAPGAAPGVLLALVRRALAACPDVISISCHRVRPDGSRRWRWHTRPRHVLRFQ